jgi:hypothetical protein
VVDPGVPGEFEPKFVPNENTTPENGLEPSAFCVVNENIAPLSRNGLCGPFPAIEPFAFG